MKDIVVQVSAAVLLLVCACASLAADFVLQPARIFDGDSANGHAGWQVWVHDGKIAAVGKPAAVQPPAGATIIELKGMTLLPGLIDAHSHILLHPYNETPWNDQVLKESHALRVARATRHLHATLQAGFTTLRDLGTEGAGYADVGLREAVASGVIPGPRLLVVTRAIVATGSYGPKGFAAGFSVPLGAEPADGEDDLIRVVRDQIGHGADWVKVYADYRWGPHGEARPTFSLQELSLVVETAASSGRRVAAHAATAAGMRRAVLAGVASIEHGDAGTPAVFRLMVQHHVALCPTLAASEAVSRYAGWRKGIDPAPQRVRHKHASFQAALEAGVTICNGSDVGVFSHGDNAREPILMVEYGMAPLAALRSATSVNADLLGLTHRVGRVRKGLLADLIAVQGNPLQDIHALRQVKFVMQAGQLRVTP